MPDLSSLASRATTVLDVAGVVLLVAFAYLVWPPAALAVAGVGCLAASWAATRTPATPASGDGGDEL